VAAQRIDEALAVGQQMLESDQDDAELVFTFLEYVTHRQEEDRALLQAVTDEMLMSEPAMCEVHTRMIDQLEQLLERGKRAGSVRPEATAADVLMLIKGLCMYPATNQPLSPETIVRHLDLVRAALTTAEYSRPLRGVSAPLPA
jgi:hypothetical protein